MIKNQTSNQVAQFILQHKIHCQKMQHYVRGAKRHCVKSVQIRRFFWAVFSRIRTLFSQCVFQDNSNFKSKIETEDLMMDMRYSL